VSAIRKIEADERRPSRQVAELLADCLEISPEGRPTFLKIARAELRVDRLSEVSPAPPPSRSSSPLPSRSSAPRHNLPTPPTPLVGREPELASLARLLHNPHCRLLTLTGPGGIGKTRLAIAAAAEQGETFPDGVYFVPLAPLNAPEFIVPTIAEAVGFAFYGPMAPKTQLLHYLRQKEMLLVLDNLEHLLDGVGLLAEMLQSAPQVKLLATSRERLSLQGEWVVDLQGLPVPSAGQTEHLESYSAISLFVERAQRVRSGFAFSARNQADVARICRSVEGMPLGIELAATWIPALSCQEIAHQIERNIDFLATSIRDLPERHRSIQAVFDHSWKLLSDEERQVLCRLSVFRGGFTREAAEQVAGATLPLLSALVAKSLLVRTAQGRYDLHELVRQYVGRRLAEVQSDHEATYARFSRYYGDWLYQQEAPLFSAEQGATLAQIIAEMDNVRAALTWAATHQDWASLNKSLYTLDWVYDMRTGFEEAITTLDPWLAALRQVDTQTAALADYQVALGHALAVLGWFCLRFGQIDRATEALEQSLGLLRAQNAPHVLADALLNRGVLHYVTGDYARCEQCVQESLRLQRTVGREVKVAQCIAFLSYASFAQGKLAEARTHISETLRLLKAMGETWATIRCQTLLTKIVSAQGDLPEAERLARETLALSRTINDSESEALALMDLGGLALRQGQHAEAQRHSRESVALLKIMGNDFWLAGSLNHLGDALHAAGDGPEAWATFREAYRVAQQAQAAPPALDAARGLADLLAQDGATEAAFELALHVAQHAAVTQATKALVEQLCATLASKLAPQQREVIRAKAQSRTFEAVVEEILATSR
jgi:predicted ATPase